MNDLDKKISKKGYFLILTVMIGMMILSGCGYSVDKMNKAIKNNDVETVEKLLKTKPNLNKGKHGIIIGNLLMTITQGGSVDDPPLVAACRYRNVGMMKLLIEHGADVNYYNSVCMTPLEEFSKTVEAPHVPNDEYIRGLELLLSNGADIYENRYNFTPYEEETKGLRRYRGEDEDEEKLREWYDLAVNRAELFIKYNNTIVVDKETDKTLFHVMAASMYTDYLEELLPKYTKDIDKKSKDDNWKNSFNISCSKK